ncbi:MAG: DUF4328 domain-containing protein [Catenulispora sp.]
MRTAKTSVGGLGTALTILLGLDAVLAALDTGALAWRNSIINSLLGEQLSVDRSTVENSDNLVRAASGLLVLCVLSTIVVFICWFWTARSNAELYAPNSGAMSVGWAIGGWFIPLANWIIPCIVARDIYRGTMRGRQDKPQGGGQITGWWWASYVLSGILLFVVSKSDDTTSATIDPDAYLKSLQDVARAGMVALPAMVLASVLGIAYVRTITGAQRARNAAGDWYGGPGPRMPAMPGTPAGYGYGYGAGYGTPMPGGFPTQVTAPPVQDARPDVRPAGARNGDATHDDPFAGFPEPPESGAGLTPPS